ncbi:MAG: glycosyltransferase involved in cell wall biosynthesis [Bacteriovoracaceae bacterium]|jgi:glycosyltransferase involved in cell wall biosynthesis
MSKPSLSIIIPVHNDLSTGFLEDQIKIFKTLHNTEIIFIDGGSTDGSIELIKESGFSHFLLENSNRAERLNLGLKKSQSELILFHHPRSLIKKEGLDYLSRFVKEDWGAFTHTFDNSSLLLKFTSWYSNEVRFKIRSIAYLDHCIFFKKKMSLKDPALLPNIDIFEDTALSSNLNALSENKRLLPFVSTTSSIRFKRNGLWKQAFLNQVLKVCWYLRLSPDFMNKIYEKGLELNSKV